MITSDYLTQILDYNKETDIFTWKVKNKRIKVGDDTEQLAHTHTTYLNHIKALELKANVF